MLEELIIQILPPIISICELMGIFVVAVSALRAFWHYCRGLVSRTPRDVKFELANGLATSLEFKMAAEILKTVLVRDLNELIVLGAVVLLRALLSLLIQAEERSSAQTVFQRLHKGLELHMTTLYLIRHAEAEGNLYRRIHGWYDALVTPNGLRQIEALEGRFAGVPVDAVYSSDLYRTKTTAKAVYIPKGLSLHTDPGLREVHMGDWEDRPWGEIRETDGERLTLFNRSDPSWRAPNGESLGQVGERMERTIRAIAQKHPDQTVALFSHGTAIRQFLANVRGVKPEDWHTLPHADNTAVACLAWDGESFHVIFEGDNTHLDDSISTLARQSWWRKGANRGEDVNLWFRPLDREKDREAYLAARRDAWISIHGADVPFDGPAFWEGALQIMDQDPWAVTAVMAREEFAGLLQLSPQRCQEEGAGFLSLCYLSPAFRGKGLGVQLLGQAVSFYRPKGRSSLRLRCSAANEPVQRFCAKHDFHKAGEEQVGGRTLDILEKYIGMGEPAGRTV